MKIDILDYKEYSKIHYYNDDCIFRTLILDLNKNIIQDEIYEYNSDGKHIANVVFASDYTTIIGMRKYTEHGFEDYRKIGDELILTQIQIIERVHPNQKSLIKFFNKKKELVFYDIFEKDEDCGMVNMGSFDKNDVQFHWDNPPDEIKSLQSYSDY